MKIKAHLPDGVWIQPNMKQAILVPKIEKYLLSLRLAVFSHHHWMRQGRSLLISCRGSISRNRYRREEIRKCERALQP